MTNPNQNKYKVVLIQSDGSNQDSKDYPDLIEYVEDEEQVFIVSLSDSEEFYTAEDFFHMHDVRTFEVLECQN
jgi:hypothetical protein